MKAGSSICVIIAAWNAERSIANAIRSALVEPEVSEVIVVDDASSDATAGRARAACDGTNRLHIVQFAHNRGPAAARNHAIDQTGADYIAVLDADDFFIPGRFARLLAVGDCDAAADNIAFIGDDWSMPFDFSTLPRVDAAPSTLSLGDFVRGNVSQRGKPRAELGFMKPMMRRAFLDRHRLRYDETLRLGEDYVLYAHMLAAGANFRLIRQCGYVAVERATSLSGRHATADLAALAHADARLLALAGLSDHARAALHAHAGQVAAKHHHRKVLNARQVGGRRHAIVAAAARPTMLPALIRAVWSDKVNAVPGKSREVRYLFT